MQMMFSLKKLLTILVFIMSTSVGYCEVLKNENPTFLPPDEAFIPYINYQGDDYIQIRWDIKDGYYLYMGMFEFSTDDPNIKITKVIMPDGVKKKDEFFGNVDVYYKLAEANVYLEQPINKNINLIVKYQGCADAGLCYPPITKKLGVMINSYNVPDFKKTSLENDQISISNKLGSQSLGLNIILFFIAGLLLSFTPCVFPMIPILTGLIVGQGNNLTPRKSFLLSLTYVLSMSITYAIIGIIVALSGSNIQANIQNPYVITMFAGLFVLLSLSMLNVIKIEMPRLMQNILINTSNQTTSGTYVGVGVMGFLSALIVGPCVTAPLIGALLYIGSTKDYIIGGAALFSLGIGMGFPLLILGSSATRIIKKIGPYLALTNKIFGLLFLVVAIWLLERILSIHASAFLWAILSILILLLFYNSEEGKILLKPTVKIIMSMFLLGYFSLQIYGINTNNNFDPATSFIKKETSLNFIKVYNSKELFKEINNSKKITMVDLYADWCVACKELDKYTFADSKVQEKLSKINLIKLDITKTNEDNKKFLSDYKLFGPPAILFFNSNGSEIKNSRIVGYVNAKIFLKKYNNIQNISLSLKL
ncbi:MAG: cytochrome C biogenesis protein [Gammaproteobacteria bacterium]|nr:cytochrome C biogenesis protein [Gammaproteobacteria bacterium]